MPGSDRSWTVRDGVALVLFLLLPVGVGLASGFATMDGVRTWYREIAKPSFTPPDAVFGPVWTTLYLMMGAAAFLVWRSAGRGARTALGWFGTQLVLNGLWSILFFGLERPGLAFAEILVLLGCILVTARLFWRHSRLAGVLMVPYVAWVSFASVLNFAIWRLNA
jgi:tryptophan-rich sensory protein